LYLPRYKFEYCKTKLEWLAKQLTTCYRVNKLTLTNLRISYIFVWVLEKVIFTFLTVPSCSVVFTVITYTSTYLPWCHKYSWVKFTLCSMVVTVTFWKIKYRYYYITALKMYTSKTYFYYYKSMDLYMIYRLSQENMLNKGINS